jgi:hypothetical protein
VLRRGEVGVSLGITLLSNVFSNVQVKKRRGWKEEEKKLIPGGCLISTVGEPGIEDSGIEEPVLVSWLLSVPFLIARCSMCNL